MNDQLLHLLSDQLGETVKYELANKNFKQLLKLVGNSFEIVDVNTKNESVTIQGKRSLLAKYFNSKGEFVGEGKPVDKQNETESLAIRLGRLFRIIFIPSGLLGVSVILELVQDTTPRIVLITIYLIFYLGVIFLPYIAEKFVSSIDAALPSQLEWGRMNLESGQYELAAKSLSRALDDDPCNADIWYMLGLAKNGNGQLDEALKCYERSISESEYNPNAWNNKGLILSKLGKRKDAIASYRIAAEQGSKEAKGNLEILGES